MKGPILFINACVSKASRTLRLAEKLLEKLDGPVEEVRLKDIAFPAVDEDFLNMRDLLISKEDFSDPLFDLAKQFAKAETIVIAAPYWDLSFPAVLRTYLENVYVTGLVSEYTPEGIPHGLCRARKLWYVTTAGGPYVPDFSYDYIRALATRCFGIPETELVMAEMLDVEGFDAETIVRETADRIAGADR